MAGSPIRSYKTDKISLICHRCNSTCLQMKFQRCKTNARPPLGNVQPDAPASRRAMNTESGSETPCQTSCCLGWVAKPYVVLDVLTCSCPLYFSIFYRNRWRTHQSNTENICLSQIILTFWYLGHATPSIQASEYEMHVMQCTQLHKRCITCKLFVIGPSVAT